MGILAFFGALGAGLIGYALLGRARARAATMESAHRAPRRMPTLDWPVESRPPVEPPAPPIEHAPPAPHAPAPPADLPGPNAAPPPTADARGAVRPPTLDEWGVALAPGCLSSGIQLPYAVQFVAMESGGNPCAVGYPASKGPDGLPLEMGIAQFYNPDDLVALGLTGEELRVYCVPGDHHETTFRGKKVRGFSQQMRMPLTPEQVRRQAGGTVGLISRSMREVTEVLTSIGAGPAWSPSRRDFWRLVKLQHGLPALISEGLPRINAKLGRPPRDWSEFKAALDTVTLGARAEAKRRQGLFPRVLSNAERCASAFEERSAS